MPEKSNFSALSIFVWDTVKFETALNADLDGRREYSNENFEGRSGEGFHENSSWTWVSRSYVTGMLRLCRLCFVSRKGLAQHQDLER